MFCSLIARKYFNYSKECPLEKSCADGILFYIKERKEIEFQIIFEEGLILTLFI